MKIFYIITFVIAYTISNYRCNGQIVTLNPSNAKAQDSVEIIYDVALSTTDNTILAGKSALNSTVASVYMHSGVVTTLNGTTWANIVGNWGMDDGVGKMTKINGTTKWRIKIVPSSYYNVPSGTNIFRLAMIFRNANGSSEGKGNPGFFFGGEVVSNGDIYVNFPAQSQIVTLNPSNAKAQDSVEIIYDVALSTTDNTILAGKSALNSTVASVYMHSGVVTTLNGTTWANIVGNWGMDDGVGKMTKINGTTKWRIKIVPSSYYNVPSGTNIFRLAMVFRNADGSSGGKGNPGFFPGGVSINGDIYVNIRAVQSITFGALANRTFGTN
ncbi:MAG: hypothetical protein QM536_08855, partial [Chitinophagaceae bacterium]|nr:hypothetical protein [Chitinophagaceae bacterium]